MPQQHTDHTDTVHTDEHDHVETCEKLPPGKVWLYSLLSSFIISLISLFAIVCLPVAEHNSVLLPLLAFAVGALLGDAMFHLIPDVMGVHSHVEEEHSEEEGESKDYLVYGSVILFGMLLFFVLERELSHFHTHTHSHHHESKLVNLPEYPPIDKRSSRQMSPEDNEADDIRQRKPSSSDVKQEAAEQEEGSDDEDQSSDHEVTEQEDPPEEDDKRVWEGPYKPLGLLSLVADGMHNAVDGIAIGVAFRTDLAAGLATAIAVFFHEVPQELGEFAILLRSNFTKKKAILWNFLSGLTNILGVVIGVIVSSIATKASKYVLAFVAGGFIYISLTDMVVELLQEKGYKQTILQVLCILGGLLLMLFIGLWVEQLSFC